MSMLENPTPFEKWMFQNAEGVETFPRDKMLEKAFNDGIKIGEDKISQHILELQADKGRLTDEVRDLKNDIEMRKLWAENYIRDITRAKEIIREYLRLSLQEDKDIDANVKLFQKAEAFLKE